MAGVNYDAWEGTKRLAEAADRIDKRAPEIFAYHAALEVELDMVLSALLPRGEKLSRLSFGHKISVLNAAWQGEHEAAEILCAALVRFNDLRNAIAHFDPEQVASCLTNLRKAYGAIEPRGFEAAEVGEIAAGICAFMGDGPSPFDVSLVSDALDGFVKRYSDIFAATKFEMPRIALPKVAAPGIPKIDLGLTRDQ